MRYLRVVSIAALLAAAPTCEVFADLQIAFYSDREGGTPGGFIERSVFVMDPDGSNLVNLSKEIGVDTLPSRSPDGTQILWIRFGGARTWRRIGNIRYGCRRIQQTQLGRWR